jgi:hypothetical protein
LTSESAESAVPLTGNAAQKNEVKAQPVAPAAHEATEKKVEGNHDLEQKFKKALDVTAALMVQGRVGNLSNVLDPDKVQPANAREFSINYAWILAVSMGAPF